MQTAEARVSRLERQSAAKEGGALCVHLEPGQTAEQAREQWARGHPGQRPPIFVDEADARL